MSVFKKMFLRLLSLAQANVRGAHRTEIRMFFYSPKYTRSVIELYLGGKITSAKVGMCDCCGGQIVQVVESVYQANDRLEREFGPKHCSGCGQVYLFAHAIVIDEISYHFPSRKN